MNTYIAIFRNKQIKVIADCQYSAVLYARKELKVPASKYGLLSVTLVAKGDTPAIHCGSSI